MLKKLLLKHVGPVEIMDFTFTRRLNLLTGDNSLGKTLVLDVAWWVLTRNWAGLPALPRYRMLGDISKTYLPQIHYTLKAEPLTSITGNFDPKTQHWKTEDNNRPLMPSLIIYARADGGFSVLDSARNHPISLNRLEARQPSSAFHFSTQTVFNGLSDGKKIVSNGLLQDWLWWQSRETEIFEVLTSILAELSPSSDLIKPGEKTVRLSLDDIRDIPTIRLSYGDVPLLHLSAGMKRIIALAYIMVWAWSEHLKASALLEQTPTHQMVLLLDEAEAHLHPQWQRRILPALLSVVRYLRSDLAVQIIAGTHAPLILASVEPEFNPATDCLFHFYLEKQNVNVEKLPWAKHGDATGWLVSEIFGLKQARSLEAEQAIDAATHLMRSDFGDAFQQNSIYQQLIKTLPPEDPFWPRWVMYKEQHHYDSSQKSTRTRRV